MCNLLLHFASALAWTPIKTYTAFALFLALVTLILYPPSPRNKATIYELGGISILKAWSFFAKRNDFLWSNFKKSGEKMFQFRALQHRIVALSGEECRKIFFTDKTLGFAEGYMILMGGGPDLLDITGQEAVFDDSPFKKQLMTLLRRERLTDILPTFFDDINKYMVGWGKEGRINPFKDVNDVVFQITVRMTTCCELADDKDSVMRLAHHYGMVDKNTTPVTLLWPWFPSSAKKAKDKATRDLYTTVAKCVESRRNAAVPSSDAIDQLIAEGCDDESIISFVVKVIFAGVSNTGINACWILLYLAAHPEWKEKVTKEINLLILKYTNTSSSELLHKRLSAIPITAWEDEMPASDSVIREAVRLTIVGSALRRNVIHDLPIAGKVIPKGSFMAYSLLDTHLNPEIYSNPFKFDPDRYGEGREEDKKGTFPFLGWGAGRHPCLGMRVAKLEVKVFISLFLAAYEYELVDKSGNFPDPFPQVDRNDLQQSRPLGEPCFLQFKRVVE